MQILFKSVYVFYVLIKMRQVALKILTKVLGFWSLKLMLKKVGDRYL